MNFADRLLKNTLVSNFIKICPVGAKLFHVDRQTMTKLIVIFCNFIKICPVGAKLFHVDRQTMMKLIVIFCNFPNMAKINHHVRLQASVTVQLRPLLFRDVMQCRYTVGYSGFRQPISSIFKGQSMFNWYVMFIHWCWASLCHMSSRYHSGMVYV